jgi:hypothetical protein
MKNTNFVKGILIGFATLVVVLVSMFGGALADRLFLIKPLDALVDRRVDSVASNGTRQILREESAVIEVVEETSPSVVTVSVETHSGEFCNLTHLVAFAHRYKEEFHRILAVVLL